MGPPLQEIPHSLVKNTRDSTLVSLGRLPAFPRGKATGKDCLGLSKLIDSGGKLRQFCEVCHG
jgi:hypothetical protein